MSTEAMLRELERAIGAIRETHEVPADFGGMARMLCFEFIERHGHALAEMVRDGERYRWLRDSCDTTTGFLLSQRLEADEWNEAIDAARGIG